jgi:two-component system sensor histidine kinase RegB
MGRAGKDDLHMRQAPLIEVIREAAEPHQDRGKEILIEDGPGPGALNTQPQILRRPEIIHGLRNLIQNAVDFASTSVWVEALWTEDMISIRIVDDGRGFPPHLIGRIGDPLMRRRRSETDKKARPEYEGMGLGLFIAKTLLERTGAELSFANASDPYQTDNNQGERKGAIVEVVWPTAMIVPVQLEPGELVGENQRFET